MNEQLFGLLFAAIGAGCFGWAQLTAAKLQRSLSWPSVRGSITRSQVASSGARSQSGYVPDVEYEYSVDRCYLGTTVNLGFQVARRRSEVEAYCARHPVGSEVKVYYDPSDASVCCLERTDPGLWIFQLVGVSFVGAGALIFLGIVRMA